ncbi:uncharacterized protein AMSG_10467 [Thecamonas trahens ATCC 50062]|uniref:Uncharacterized protein n=1 Tax=Thecamonas trahens ATCC 50062 TaxID=461836 RepID=A0A0L0DQC0_THETB|nr:hypothetical protein AMSG_10467 [Thecamonas trahens ATCC 50062]KNC54470.1 hypothetical protein AMSG_10467 [Thecamonas trahens ATCC 50062]|eukprot:XP_013753625.1 hypothetical protein AMSG_10467 [Thecamonas trahens ATCC 50062]
MGNACCGQDGRSSRAYEASGGGGAGVGGGGGRRRWPAVVAEPTAVAAAGGAWAMVGCDDGGCAAVCWEDAGGAKESGGRVAPYAVLDGRVAAVAADDALVAAVARGGHLVVDGREPGGAWTSGGRRIEARGVHTRTVAAVAVAGREGRVATGGRDTAVKVWDVGGGAGAVEVWAFARARNLVTALGFVGSTTLVQAAEDLRVNVWDVRAPATSPAQVWSGLVNIPKALAVRGEALESALIATGHNGFDGSGCEINVLDPRMAGRIAAQLVGHRQAVTGVAWASASELLSASADGSLAAWDWRLGRQTASERDGASGALTGLGYDAKSATAFTLGAHSALYAWRYHGAGSDERSSALDSAGGGGGYDRTMAAV